MNPRPRKAISVAAAIMLALPTVCLARETANAAVPTRSDDPVLRPVTLLIQGLNSGEVDAVQALHTDDATIIDSIPPFLWSGPKAYVRLMRDYEAVAVREQIGTTVVELLQVDRIEKTGALAYVAASGRVKSVEKSVSTVEEGKFVFTLKQIGGDWKISAWAWTAMQKTATASGAAGK